MNKTRVLVFMALFISLEVVLTRFFSIQTPIVRIGFGFLPVALSSIMLGPIIGGITAAVADVVRMFAFPSGFPYFPGFTFSALASGMIYGLFLYKKPKTLLRIALAVLTVTVVVDLGLNTLWLTVFMGNAMSAFAVRLVKSLIMFPIQVALIHLMWRYIGAVAEKAFPLEKKI